MRITFFPIADRTQGSSRLRAFVLGEALAALGHDVGFDRAGSTELAVFQKRRDVDAIAAAASRGARVVYDFDDHYLSSESGAKDEILRVLNLVDVVTVGSSELLAACRAYHPNVRLFENPLDVAPSAAPRAPRPWGDRVGWFGNRAGLVALESLGLARHVITITAHGELAWALDTVDTNLASLDLVLLPVETTEWAHAKNANRMLKCAALQVPFLASATPEHRRALEQLGLPDWLLVARRNDWPDAIERVRARYDELLSLLPAARARAEEAHGVSACAARWLEAVTDRDAPGLAVPERTLAFARELDVIVLAERTPELARATRDSLDASGAVPRSVSVLATLPLDGVAELTCTDYADLYAALTRTLAARQGAYTLVLQAGARLTPAALEALADATEAHAGEPPIVLLRPQLERGPDRGAPRPGAQLAPSPPTTLELLREPLLPFAMLIPRALSTLDPKAGALWAWELLVRVASEDPTRIVRLDAPVVLLARETHERTPLAAHRDPIARSRPSLLAELPPEDLEWRALRATLAARIVEKHRALFEHWVVALLTTPEPSAERRLEELTATLHKTKKRLKKLARALDEKAPAPDPEDREPEP